MQTVHLDVNDVPAHLRQGYSGRKFTMVVTETVSINKHDGYWSGGSRDSFHAIRLSDGAILSLTDTSKHPMNIAPGETVYNLVPGYGIRVHSIFCGKDIGYTFYIHPQDAAPMLPKPVELADDIKTVLKATMSFKSSYMGRDRFDMAKADAYGKPFMTRDQWEKAKSIAIEQGYLNKAGAITTKGKNAVR